MEAKRTIAGKAIGQVGEVTFRLSAGELFVLEAMNQSLDIDSAGQLTLFCVETRAEAVEGVTRLKLFAEEALRWLSENVLFDAAIQELETGLRNGHYQVKAQRAQDGWPEIAATIAKLS